MTKLQGDSRACHRCDTRGGGSCKECGYPRAYAHPDCVSDALGMDVVYIGGTAMTVTGSTGVTFGKVNIMQRDGSFQSYEIPPKSLNAGDYVRWDNPLFDPGQVWIEGVLDEDPRGCHARIRIVAFNAVGPSPGWHIGRCTDIRAERGTLRRISAPALSQPLDIVYDGVTLRDLINAQRMHDQGGYAQRVWTAAQRAAVSAHWSAELSAKVKAGEERERTRVQVDLQD